MNNPVMDFKNDSKSIPVVDPSFEIASTASILLPDPLSERLRPQPAPVPSKHNTVRATIHDETHGIHSDITRDIIIGFADGLTVPFALTAGLSSLGSAKLVVIAGLAELFSGAISMGLGAYLAAVTERDHYLSEEKREREEVENTPDEEKEEIYEIMHAYGVNRDATTPLVDALASNSEQWVRFMMDFELKLEKPKVSKAWISAATMGAAYFIGGVIPMIPYFGMKNVTHALFISIGITVVILLAFGFIKNYVTIRTRRAGAYGAVQTLIVGVLAAATSYGIVRAIDYRSPVETMA